MCREQQASPICEIKIDRYTIKLQFSENPDLDLIQNVEELLINSIIQKEISDMDKITNI